MKKIIVAGILFLASVAYCVDQPQNIGYVETDSPLYLWTRTLAQMNALVPLKAGGLIAISNAANPYQVCISSGTGAGAWVIVSISSGAISASAIHCQ